MAAEPNGNLLLVSNYPSDTAYAWWLMQHFWLLLAEWAFARGMKVFLAYPKITVLSQDIRDSGIQVVELALPWTNDDEATAAKTFLRKNSVRWVYLIDQPYWFPVYAKLRCCGVRKIVVHDHTPGDRPPVGGVRGVMKSLINRLPAVTADLFINVSPLMRRRSLENGRIPEEKCVSVQNGIPAIACRPGIRDVVRAGLGISSKTNLIVASGRAHPYKRFDFIIECAGILRSLAPQLDFAMVLIGDGPAMQELRSLVQKLNLEGYVLLLGFRTDVHDVLCASDIAIHAALGEGFSLSILEHMSAGLPVLVPDIPSVCQAIRAGETGFIYPQRDPRAAAKYLQQLIENPSLRAAMGAAARYAAETEFSLERCTDEFRNVLLRL